MTKIIPAPNQEDWPRYEKFSNCVALIAAIFIFQPSAFAEKNIKNARFSDADSMKGITIHQEINFKASRERLYKILLSSKQFSDCIKKSFPDFSTSSAKIDSAVGGAFSVFDGHIIGRILELV